MELLTTLAAVKDWLNIPSDVTDGDAELVRLIRAGSQYALNYMGRPSFGPHDVIENVSGNGSSQQLLREWPVLSVASVGTGGRAINASVMGNAGLYNAGYKLSDLRNGDAAQSVDLIGDAFWYRSQVQIAYRAGYQATDTVIIETEDVGDPPVAEVIKYACGLRGLWVSETAVLIDGVGGVKLTSADPLPSTGEYYVDSQGVYTFSVDDVGKTALITYGFVPWDIAVAVTQLIAETQNLKGHIGVKTKMLAGQESITYFDSVMTPSISMVFQQYMNVVPY